MVVLKNTLPEQVSSIDHAKGLSQRNAGSVIDFAEVTREEVDVNAGENAYASLYYVFDGKETEDAKVKRFFQTSVVKGKDAFIITGAAIADEDESVLQSLSDAVKSFRAK